MKQIKHKNVLKEQKHSTNKTCFASLDIMHENLKAIMGFCAVATYIEIFLCI